MYKSICVSLLFVALGIASNTEPSENGSFCIVKPPKRSVSANCTSTEMCELLLNVSPVPSATPVLECGDHGECVTSLTPGNEYCKDACESSACSSLCLQLYETKAAQYCIETRDHPNAMPSNSRQNKYFCTCLVSNNSFYKK